MADTPTIEEKEDKISSLDKSPSPPTTNSDCIILPEAQFIVERILARRTRRGKTEYLLKWFGYPSEDNTWEAESDIHPDLVTEFNNQILLSPEAAAAAAAAAAAHSVPKVQPKRAKSLHGGKSNKKQKKKYYR